MSRYALTLARVILRLGQEQRGWALLQCAPTEEPEVAALIAAGLGWPHVALTDDVEEVASCVITIPRGLGPAARDAALAALNGRRDRLSARAVRVLVVNRNDLVPLQRHAADLFSVLRVTEVIPFIPRTLDAAEAVAARRQLAAHYRERFGRLDLRGFIRSEGEDVSFAIEDIFEPLEAVMAPPPERTEAVAPMGERAWSGRLVDLVLEQASPVLVIGGPGSGKSFFLRWLTLAAIEGRLAESERAQARGWWPVLVPLAVVGLAPGTPGLMDYAIEALLVEHLAAAHLIGAAARAGRVLFLLDGLDETGDQASRRATLAAVAKLGRIYPASRIVATTRPSGLDDVGEDLARPATRLVIDGLSDTALCALLVRWCELYEHQREGTALAAARGRTIGERLARDVLAVPAVRALAATPLLATIIAVVHRAGLRLPDRRVELYDHVVRILVERWNRVRTRDVAGATTIRVPDAIRLLGPVALAMIEHDREGAVDEPMLRDFLARALVAGNVRGVDDPDAAIRLFRESLGLLVERAPGVYGFVHQTLVEFLAAHELIRTDRFAELTARPRAVFEPRWREVILLGAGILGVLQANDERLGQVIRRLVDSARRRRARPSPAVPRLLGQLLADDPGLTAAHAQALLEELIPTWWFDLVDVDAPWEWMESSDELSPRVMMGAWGDLARMRMSEAYARGLNTTALESPAARVRVIQSLALFDVEIAPLLCEVFLDSDDPPGSVLWWRAFERVEVAAATAVGDCRLTAGMAVLLRRTVSAGVWAVYSVAQERTGPTGPWRPVHVEDVAGADRVRVHFEARVDASWRGGVAFVVHDSPEAIAAVLGAWRELADSYPDAPKPP